MKVSKHRQGCYRVSNNQPVFGQIRKEKKEWYAEIRCTHSGVLLRYAGIWSKLADGIEEVEYILKHY